MQHELKTEILKEVPEAQIEFVVGEDGQNNFPSESQILEKLFQMPLRS